MSSGSRRALLAALLPVLAAGCGQAVEREGDPAAEPAQAALEEAPLFAEANQLEVTLYFLSADGEALVPETRRIFRTTTVTDRARQTVQALLDGPEGPLMRPLPPGTRLREVFIAADGTAFVDLGPEFRWGIEAGSSDAVYAIYAIVNTLTDSFEEIRRVKILLEGDEAEDVGGHFDLSRPILPEHDLVRPG